MITENICPKCGTVTEVYTPPYMRRSTPPAPKEKKFFVNGVVVSAMVRPYDDAFFEIVTGKYKGNLIHTFDIIK